MWCLVYLLDLYISKLSPWAKENYVFIVDKQKAFLSLNLGSSLLQLGKKNYANTLLKCAGATSMFAANVSERIIRDVTGHR